VVWFDPTSKPEIFEGEHAQVDLVGIDDMRADPTLFYKMVQHFSVQVSDAHYEGLEGAQTIPEINLILNNDASYFHNHSCDPNCWFSAANSSTMVARRDIKPGEEITFEYGLQESADFPWTKRCRGRIRPTDWIRLCDEQWYPDDAFAPHLKEKIDERQLVLVEKEAAATANTAAAATAQHACPVPISGTQEGRQCVDQVRCEVCIVVKSGRATQEPR